MTQSPLVRRAVAADMIDLVAMLRELAAFEQADPADLRCRAEDFVRDGFGERPLFTALIGEREGSTAGFLMLIPTYSSWRAQPGLMIHDLFVRPMARRGGLGRALVEAAVALAAEQGCGRIEVNVLSWNSARRFYEGLGFAPQTDWVLHRRTL